MENRMHKKKLIMFEEYNSLMIKFRRQKKAKQRNCFLCVNDHRKQKTKQKKPKEIKMKENSPYLMRHMKF